MGGSKSRPIQESARTVLARRRKDVVESIASIPAPTLTPTPSSTSSQQQSSSSSSSISPSSTNLNTSGQSTIDRINNHIEKPNTSISIGPHDGLDLDPKILNTIDKWVLKESKVNYPGHDTNKTKMATTIRLKEEQDILKESGKMPMNIKGRLTEDQTSRLYELIKENDVEKSTDEYLSNQFHISIDTIKTLKKIARKPNIYYDGWGEVNTNYIYIIIINH